MEREKDRANRSSTCDPSTDPTVVAVIARLAQSAERRSNVWRFSIVRPSLRHLSLWCSSLPPLEGNGFEGKEFEVKGQEGQELEGE